jgi:hypothetical protein
MCTQLLEFDHTKQTRGLNDMTKHPLMHAVQTDPRTEPWIGPKVSPRKEPKISPRTRPKIDPKTEQRSDIDTSSKDWSLERINRGRSDPSFSPPKWHERMKTSDHPKLVTIREPQPSEDNCCSEIAAFKGRRMPVHEGEPPCPAIPVYRCRCE